MSITHDFATTVRPVHRRPLPGGATIADHRWTDTQASVVVTGEVDAHDAHALTDVLTSVVLDGARSLEVDLRGCTFVDVTALRMIARTARFIRRVGGSVDVITDSARVATLWTMLLQQSVPR